MKGIGKIIVGIMTVSILLVLYVHEQVALLHVSYMLDTRVEKVTRLSEEYRQLRFEVEQLKAPRLLEEKMKQLSLDLTLPKEIRVMRVPAPELEKVVHQVSSRPSSGGVLDFVGRWVDVAQAKTDSE